MTNARRITVLGSTGSIGTQALDIVRQNPEQFSIVGISAGGSNVELLAAQVIEFNVAHVGLAQASVAQDLQIALYAHAQKHGYAQGEYSLPVLHIGPQAATEIAALDCDVVLNGITGAVGLMPTVAALKAGSTLALANKESLVIGGKAVTSLAAPGQIVPVDSEHSALAQCLRSGSKAEVKKLILTASGGPFRGKTRTDLESVTAEMALNHPTWSMGPVVTVNSSTLMNKGLELIEAHLLFEIPMDRIDVVVHPQSIVHSMVEFIDGSTIAQASPPDMHLPIALGINWPNRLAESTSACDWSTATSWTFEPVDHVTFPAIELAKKVGVAGGTAPAVFNSANEVAVEQFLAGNLPYLNIVELVSRVVADHLNDGFVSDERLTIDEVLNAHRWAEQYCRQLLSTSGGLGA